MRRWKIPYSPTNVPWCWFLLMILRLDCSNPIDPNCSTPSAVRWLKVKWCDVSVEVCCWGSDCRQMRCFGSSKNSFSSAASCYPKTTTELQLQLQQLVQKIGVSCVSTGAQNRASEIASSKHSYETWGGDEARCLTPVNRHDQNQHPEILALMIITLCYIQ